MSPKHRVFLALAAIAVVAACDTRPTEPSPTPTPSQVRVQTLGTAGAATLGDTTQCRSGWVIINGRYVCN